MPLHSLVAGSREPGAGSRAAGLVLEVGVLLVELLYF